MTWDWTVNKFSWLSQYSHYSSESVVHSLHWCESEPDSHQTISIHIRSKNPWSLPFNVYGFTSHSQKIHQCPFHSRRQKYFSAGIYIFVFFSLTNVLDNSLLGFQGSPLEELEIKRAPSFCRSEGAFPFCIKETDMFLYFTIIHVVV